MGGPDGDEDRRQVARNAQEPSTDADAGDSPLVARLAQAEHLVGHGCAASAGAEPWLEREPHQLPAQEGTTLTEPVRVSYGLEAGPDDCDVAAGRVLAGP